MKKAYTKPELLFESYELNTAGNCAPGLGEANATGPETCTYKPNDLLGFTLFYSTNPACEVEAADEGFCYQNVSSPGPSGFPMFQS